MAKGLNAKRQRFVDEYLIDFHITKAAIRAGYSAKTAYSSGQRLLKNVDICEAIAAGKAKQTDRTQIDADWVLREMASLYQECRGAGEYPPAVSALEKVGKHVGVRAFVPESKGGKVTVEDNPDGSGTRITVEFINTDSDPEGV